jgi:hypothetical protein
MGSAGSAREPEPPKNGNVATMSAKAISFRRPRFEAQETMDFVYGPGAICGAGAVYFHDTEARKSTEM